MSWTHFCIAFDLHGDLAHAPTVKAFHRFCAEFKPKARIVGGDVWDFTRLRTNASGKDLSRDLLPDYQAGADFLREFRPDSVLLGNHDHRLWRAAEEKGHRDNELARDVLRQFKNLRKEVPCAVLPYSKTRVVSCGPLNILHGFYAGQNACRQHAAVYGPCIFGHVHTAEHAVVPRHGGTLEAWSAPCMARLDFDYADQTPSTLKWINGWMYGAFKGKRYHVETARVEHGSVVYSTSFTARAA